MDDAPAIPLEQLFAVVPPDCTQSVLETNDLFCIKATGFARMPVIAAIENVFAVLPQRDHLTISLNVGNNDPDAISSLHLDKIPNVMHQWNRQILNADDQDSLVLEIIIVKNRRERCVSIYSLEAYSDYLLSLTLQEQFEEFGKLTQRQFTRCLTATPLVGDPSLLLTFGREATTNTDVLVDRNTRLDKITDVCNAGNIFLYRFIPEDFAVKQAVPAAFKSICTRLECLLSFAFLVDRCELNGNEFTYQLRGFKTIKSVILDGGWNEATHIRPLYEWAYTGSTSADKVSLIRNLLSLNLGLESIPNPPDWLISAARSNFEIYLKKNVAQYLDVKAKMENAMADIASKIAQQSDILSAGFKSNLSGFFALFVSVVVVSATKGTDLMHVFTPQIVLLASFSVCASLLYLFLSMAFLWIGVKRVQGTYTRLKKRYSDVLVQEDIKRIAGDDFEYKLSLRQVRISFYITTFFWVSMLAGVMLALYIGELIEWGLSPL